MSDYTTQRERMVERHIASRGLRDPAVLQAFQAVPREQFVPHELEEFAYEDAPLPIGEGQTISQPYVVALMIQALKLKGTERVLEIGTGCGYAAAVLSRIAREVYSVERIEALATSAKERLATLGFSNVHVLQADGSMGWPEHAPYDAIAVAAGGPKVPEALVAQLAIGGRLVIPVGPDEANQTLTVVTRESESKTSEVKLVAVRFVPLIGEQGFSEELTESLIVMPGADPEPAIVGAAGPDEEGQLIAPPTAPLGKERDIPGIAKLVREACERIDDIDGVNLDALLERIADSQVVLIGEASHGTSEFYRMRARITKELIKRKGFNFVAVEADWPDAARIDEYARDKKPHRKYDWSPFARFPVWMWRNQDVADFIEWLRAHNAGVGAPEAKVGFHGLDLYSMFTSMGAVLAYLDDVDPEAARVARARYGALTPWQRDPAAYGLAVLRGKYKSSESAVVAMLRDMLERRFEYAARDGERFFDAAQNARVVANAERYYRSMYYGSAESWNLRDSHMFDALRSLLAFYGPGAKGVVWEHNSHVGDASATEMSARGEHNVGQLCREHFGKSAYIIGFGTDRGTVAAAHNWDEPMEVMNVRPAHSMSYEGAFREAGVAAFLLHLRNPARRAVRDELMPSRLERAIGVIYRPQTELLSHYFYSILPRQFDEYIWFTETSALVELAAGGPAPTGLELPETYPFGV
jgi:protein-L-isoaspartate(D-aspartate) O-methyltransferase